MDGDWTNAAVFVVVVNALFGVVDIESEVPPRCSVYRLRFRCSGRVKLLPISLPATEVANRRRNVSGEPAPAARATVVVVVAVVAMRKDSSRILLTATG
jgi:hypothetical protein